MVPFETICRDDIKRYKKYQEQTFRKEQGTSLNKTSFFFRTKQFLSS